MPAMPDNTHGYADDDMVSVDVAAEIAGVHPNTLRRWSDAGTVAMYRTPSNRRRFKVADLRNLIRPVDPPAESEQPAVRAS